MKLQREAAGLSQHDLARRLGWPQSKVSRIESGEQRLFADEAASIAAVLSITVGRIYSEFE